MALLQYGIALPYNSPSSHPIALAPPLLARCTEAGMDGYLSKPVMVHDLEEALKRCA